jgi:hypothetical protein
LDALSRKAQIEAKLASQKEIVMNTDKVIELGKVSEETKGVVGILESLVEPHRGPPA